MDEVAKAKWRALIRSHAAALKRESAALSQRLMPILPGSGAGGREPAINSDEDLLRAVRELFGLCSASDRIVRAALSISNDSTKAAEIRSGQLARDLKSIETIATRISRQ